MLFFILCCLLQFIYKQDLNLERELCSNFVSHNAALADTLSNKKPESNFCRDQSVKPGILNDKNCQEMDYHDFIQSSTLTVTCFHFPVLADLKRL